MSRHAVAFSNLAAAAFCCASYGAETVCIYRASLEGPAPRGFASKRFYVTGTFDAEHTGPQRYFVGSLTITYRGRGDSALDVLCPFVTQGP